MLLLLSAILPLSMLMLTTPTHMSRGGRSLWRKEKRWPCLSVSLLVSCSTWKQQRGGPFVEHRNLHYNEPAGHAVPAVLSTSTPPATPLIMKAPALIWPLVQMMFGAPCCHLAETEPRTGMHMLTSPRATMDTMCRTTPTI